MNYETLSPTLVSWRPAWSEKPLAGDPVLISYRLPSQAAGVVTIGTWSDVDRAWRLIGGPIVSAKYWAPLPPAPRSL